MRVKVLLNRYLLIAVVSMAAAIGLNNIILFLDLAKYSPGFQEAAEILFAPSFGEQLIYSGILAPLVEEVIFRGGIFRLLRKKLSFLWGAVLSSLLFGIYHGNLVQFIYATLLGMLLAYVYEKYGSLKAPIVAHVAANVVVCMLTWVDGFTWMFASPIFAISITVGCAAVVRFGIGKIYITKPLQKC